MTKNREYLELLSNRVNGIISKGYKIVQTNFNGIGYTDFSKKEIFINDNLSWIAKHYIFIHESVHVLDEKNNSGIMYFDPSIVEKADKKAIEMLEETNFPFNTLFMNKAFRNIEEEYGKDKAN